ncbi:hypothetical protein [Paenochrobactrum glaciei]|uniref:Uncharacterized protein n=1 Tax=Paenochrobactrum glaciei TaxID=486407 RepID=A0ABN1FEB3_9HYPH
MAKSLTDLAEQSYWNCEGNTRQALENVTRVISEQFKETIISISVENERLKAKLAEREAEYT